MHGFVILRIFFFLQVRNFCVSNLKKTQNHKSHSQTQHNNIHLHEFLFFCAPCEEFLKSSGFFLGCGILPADSLGEYHRHFHKCVVVCWTYALVPISKISVLKGVLITCCDFW